MPPGDKDPRCSVVTPMRTYTTTTTSTEEDPRSVVTPAARTSPRLQQGGLLSQSLPTALGRMKPLQSSFSQQQYRRATVPTPATCTLMTPSPVSNSSNHISSDFDDQEEDFVDHMESIDIPKKVFCIQPQDSSSASASSSPNTSPIRAARDPSPQGRALFRHASPHGTKLSHDAAVDEVDLENPLVVHNFPETRKLRVRSRCHPNSFLRRSHSRRHSQDSNTAGEDDLLILAPSFLETDDLSSSGGGTGSHPRWRKQRQYSHQRRKTNAHEHITNNNNSAWKWMRVSTRSMIWWLCITGLTSIGTIVLMNQTAHTMEHKDHIAVLFHHPQPRFRTPETPLSQTTTTTTTTTSHKVSLNQISKKIIVPSRNMHDLSHNSKDNIETHEKHPSKSPPPPESEKKKKKKKKKKNDKTKKQPQHEDKHPSKEKHRHDHHHHNQSTNHHSHSQVVEAAMDLASIPSIVLPSDIIRNVPEHSVLDSISQFRAFPESTEHRRVVGMEWEVDMTRPSRSLELYPAKFTDNTQYYSILDSNDERVSKTMERRRQPYAQGECVPMQEWQTTFHPSCNGMHELDMSGSNNPEDDIRLFGMKGFWRNAWRYDSIGGHQRREDRDTVVLKTLKINHRFEDAYFENHRIDAVVLERLTASPHVINLFGFCGHSVITEYADGKRIGELADKKRTERLARLRIARDVANGLADVHGIDGDGNATFVHMDINPANVVSIGGTLKLNDFNIGILRRWNTTSNEPCGIPAQYPNPQWRSPEEARNEKNLTEKIDVFSLGHIFFRLICGHEPWHKLEPDGMPPKDILNEKVKQGILPTIPEEIMDSLDPEIVAIRDAMLRCYTYDPRERPSAREIANSLQHALDQLETGVKAS